MSEYVEIERVFTTDPRRLVRAWTDPVEVEAWSGPDGAAPTEADLADQTATMLTVPAAEDRPSAEISIREDAAGAKLTVRQGPFNEAEQVAEADQDWQAKLAKLDAFVNPSTR